MSIQMTEQQQQEKREKLSGKFKKFQEEQTEAYRTYVKTSAVGLEFGLSIAIGALLGYFVDRYFGWSPYGLLVGIVIGCIAGAKRLWIFVKKYLAKNENHNGDE